MLEAIGEEGIGGGGGGSFSGAGVAGGVGGRIDKVGGRKERLGGLGGGIGLRVEMDFASSSAGMFFCSTVGSLGLDPRLGLSVKCCALSDLLRPIQFLECASRGIGEGRLSEEEAAAVDCIGSRFGLEILSAAGARGLLWALFKSEAEDEVLWEVASSEGRGGSRGARGAMALWMRGKVGGRGEVEVEGADWDMGEEKADWKVSKVKGVA